MPKMEVANWAKESGKLGEGRKAAPQLVRFPNSLCCELGERSAYNQGIELPWQIVAKKLIESGERCT